MQNNTLLDDGLNPRFVHYSRVSADEIDSTGSLDSSGFSRHIGDAISAWCLSAGRGWKSKTDDSDRYHVIPTVNIEILNPRVWATTMRIDLWVADLDDTTCIYGFTCSSEDGNVAYARGEETVAKIDPGSQRPATWSAPFLAQHSMLLKDLQAYA